MDGTRFDDLVRDLIGGASPRRLFLRLSALPLAGGLAAFLLDDSQSEARKRKNRKKKKKRKNKKKRKSKVECIATDVSVQAAIDAAAAGDTITLCAGTFTGNLTIDKDLTLTGAGEEATTLQGDGSGTVVTIAGGTVRLEDLRITGGAGAELGGGIHNTAGATLTLSGCTITDNNTDNGYGNGIYNAEGATLTVDHCTISGNGLDAPGAPYGGAIYNEGALSVTNSALSGNRANYGAALYDFSDGGVTLTGCDISDNVAFDDPDFEESGGAIYTEGLPTLTITGCTIRNNSGARYGGGVSLHTGAVITNCEISGNSAIEGGGIYMAGSLTIDNTEVIGNSATTGGGIYTFGQVDCTDGVTLSDNTPDDCFSENTGACDLCTGS